MITSRQNPAFKALLAARKNKSLLLLEGHRLVQDALQRGITPQLMAATPAYIEQHGEPAYQYTLLNEHLFNKIASTNSPQGILIFCEQPWTDLSQIGERILILDRLQDPGNVGTILRTAEAFGFESVLFTPGTASPFGEKAVRASMGSCLSLKLARAELGDIQELKLPILALSLEGSEELGSVDLSGPLAICMGQEADGVHPEIMKLAAKRVRIPMSGRTESLNVAVAAAVVMAKAAGI